MNKMWQMIKQNKILMIILLGSFFVCVAYAFYFKINPVVDAQAYDQIAQNIIAGNGFVEDAGADIKFDKAIIRVGPLYEYFLAGVYIMFGHHYEAVWLLQAFLHILSAVFIYLSAGILFKNNSNKEKISLVSAVIIGFFPDLIEISAMLMTETLYIFLWTLFLWYFLKFADEKIDEQKNKYIHGVLLGLVSGLAVLARPPVLFVLPVMFLYFILKKNLAVLAVLLLSIGAVFIPWTVRNYQAYNKIMPFGGAGGYNFWIGNHVGATGEQDKPEEVEPFIEKNGAYLVSDESIKQFQIFVMEHPVDFLRLTLSRISHYFSIARPMGFWFYDSGLSQFLFILSSVIASVFLFIFTIFGIIKNWSNQNNLQKYWLWFAVTTPLILFITVVETRYRFQIYPLLAVFAAYGAVEFWQNKSLWKSRAFIFSVSIIFLNAIVDLALSMDKLKEKLGLFF